MKKKDFFIFASNLTKTFFEVSGRINILQGTELKIRQGEILTILGVSGTGKSTFLNIIGGIDSFDSGKLIVGGRDLGSLTSGELTDYRRKTVGFIFQFYNLMHSLSAIENVMCALEAAGKPNAKTKKALAEHLLVSVGLGNKMDKFPAQLSGGEQQRVAIARALVKSPPLILADEPTGNLDTETGKQILEVLISQARLTKATLLIVTHNHDITDFSDKSLRLVNGQLKTMVD